MEDLGPTLMAKYTISTWDSSPVGRRGKRHEFWADLSLCQESASWECRRLWDALKRARVAKVFPLLIWRVK